MRAVCTKKVWYYLRNISCKPRPSKALESRKLSTDQLISQLTQIRSLKIPKTEITEEEIGQFRHLIKEDSQSWYYPCTHNTNPPISQEILNKAEERLLHTLPSELRALLEISDGGSFFIVPKFWFPDEIHVEYHLFSATEIAGLNEELFQRFRELLGDDPDFKDSHVRNYLAFCDAHDGNYLAISLDEQSYGRVFFLFNEYLYG